MLTDISVQSAIDLIFVGFFFGVGFAIGTWLFGLIVAALQRRQKQ